MKMVVRVNTWSADNWMIERDRSLLVSTGFSVQTPGLSSVAKVGDTMVSPSESEWPIVDMLE